ncbi:hypothetical protein NUW54_g702 [Trametes sanguinea]|uniref:Uncharacterized protein n=2 Tax=Trametes sanguinea TaxID=158606 RepID=A0ACC1Q8F3_9APHY|nr:hypothetical protein NUW54_g2123 [Trametes sanguinea]KAJ3016912.1 hypothetical protein NUW54_g702 [Trametes sanguinea]
MAPAGTTELSSTKRSQIVTLRKEGLTYGQIDARLGVAQLTCCKAFQHYKAHKTFHSLRRSGRPQALTLYNKQIIIRTIRQHCFWSYKKVGMEAGGYTELQLHRVVRKAGYHRYVAHCNLYLSIATRHSCTSRGRGGLDAERYVAQVLEGPLLAFYTQMQDQTGKRMLVVEDGAPAHKAKVTEKARQQLGIKQLEHPLSSPDLNPIKPLWFKLKKRVQDTPGAYKSLDSLWEAAKVAWEEMSDEVVRWEMSKMGVRVWEVLKVHGRHIRF